MTRGEVAERSGVSRETVRYYERRGMIPEPPRTDGDYRIYDEKYVERIRFIKRAQELGFSLGEIEELLELRVDPDGDCGDVRSRATAKLVDVREKIDDLRRIEAALTSLADACSGEGPTSECPILEAIEDRTAAGEINKRSQGSTSSTVISSEIPWPHHP
ncbi:MAG: MerR family DNA-binding protein [Rhodothermales bacterium]